jgi:hypothetical protein
MLFLIMLNMSMLNFSSGSMFVAKKYTMFSTSTNQTNHPLLLPFRSDHPALSL